MVTGRQPFQGWCCCIDLYPGWHPGYLKSMPPACFNFDFLSFTRGVIHAVRGGLSQKPPVIVLPLNPCLHCRLGRQAPGGVYWTTDTYNTHHLGCRLGLIRLPLPVLAIVTPGQVRYFFWQAPAREYTLRGLAWKCLYQKDIGTPEMSKKYHL